MGKTRSRRASLRHPGHDYTTPGAYFVTVCALDRRPLFGTVHNGVTEPNIAGEMVTAAWHQLSAVFPGVMLDALQLMPDHIHGIVVLGTDPTIAADLKLSNVMWDFKSRSTTWYLAAARSGLIPRVDGQVWQRGYYDRIIRSERELEHIRAYIAGNPERWWERQG